MGKFGQRSNMSQTKYVTEVSEFYEILLDDKLDNKNFQFINDDMVQMTYYFKNQFVDNSKNTNVYIACFTTSHARLMLYNKLDYLKEKILYFDTDSIIYADDGTKNVKTGDMLGDMTDEISGKGINSLPQQALNHTASNTVTMNKCPQLRASHLTMKTTTY